MNGRGTHIEASNNKKNGVSSSAKATEDRLAPAYDYVFADPIAIADQALLTRTSLDSM